MNRGDRREPSRSDPTLCSNSVKKALSESFQLHATGDPPFPRELSVIKGGPLSPTLLRKSVHKQNLKFPGGIFFVSFITNYNQRDHKNGSFARAS